MKGFFYFISYLHKASRLSLLFPRSTTPKSLTKSVKSINRPCTETLTNMDVEDTIHVNNGDFIYKTTTKDLTNKVHRHDNLEDKYEKITKSTSFGIGVGASGGGVSPSANIGVSISYMLKKDSVDFNSTASYNISSSIIQHIANPVQTAKQTWRDVKVVGAMEKNAGKAFSKEGLAISEKLQAAQFGIQHAADPTVADIKSKDAKTINTATEQTSEKLKNTFEKVLTHNNKNVKVSVENYQGQDPSLQRHKLSKDAAAYIIGQDKILINTQGTNLEKGSDIARS